MNMKAAVYYGVKDIRIEEIKKPKPGPGEILMKNITALTCGTDVKQFLRGYPKFKKGEIITFGHESAGIVEEVGEGVTKFKVGDRIAPHNSAPCNECYYCKIGEHSMCDNLLFMRTAYSEYRLIPEPIVRQNTFLIPDNVSFRSAALLEPLGSAIHGIEVANIKLMDTVVINGAGPLGLMMIKIAKLKGAFVISTDINEGRLKIAKKMGADIVLNVKDCDNTPDLVKKHTKQGRGADVAIEATGRPEVWESSIYMVRKGGTVVEFGGLKSGAKISLDATLVHYSQITVKGVFHTTPKIVEQAFKLIERNIINEELLVNDTYSLNDFQLALEAHMRGEVIKNEIRCDI